MPLDPQIAAMLSNARDFPEPGSVSAVELRERAKAASANFPKLDVPLADVRDSEISGPAGVIPIRIYTPEGTAPFPVILFLHGGGYVLGDLDSKDMLARALCHGAGAVVVSANYRHAPEDPFPAAVDDSIASLQWLAVNARKMNGDPHRLAVAGDSAGANLSAVIAMWARDAGGPPIAAQILFYGSMNYPSEATSSAIEFQDGPILTAKAVQYFWGAYLRNPDEEQHDWRASPVRATNHSALPPAFVATGECDPSRDDGEAYAEKLAQAGVEVDLRRYAGMPHGFTTWLSFNATARQSMDDACSFLREKFGLRNKAPGIQADVDGNATVGAAL